MKALLLIPLILLTNLIIPASSSSGSLCVIGKTCDHCRPTLIHRCQPTGV